MDLARIVLGEYQRILAYAVGPASVFIAVGLIVPFENAPPFICPVVFLSLLTILSCFVFDDDGPDAFFVQPQERKLEKGVRLVGVKLLELIADAVVFNGCGFSGTDRRVPFKDMDWGATALYAISMSIMIVSFLRSAIIFPLSAVTFFRATGRSITYTPIDHK